MSYIFLVFFVFLFISKFSYGNTIQNDSIIKGIIVNSERKRFVIGDYANTTFLNDSLLQFNITQYLMPSTRLVISNSTIFFNTNLSTSVELVLQPQSRLEIYNSHVICNSTYNRANIKLLGGSVFISNSEFNGLGFGANSPGIQLINVTGMIINSNFTNGLHGISLKFCSEINISNCFFSNQKGNGIDSQSSEDVIIRNSEFQAQRYNGINLYESNFVDVENNKFYDLPLAIELISSDNTRINNNSILQFQVGIRIEGSVHFGYLSQNITVSNNSLQDGEIFGVYIEGLGKETNIELGYTEYTNNLANVWITHNEINEIGKVAIEFRSLDIFIHNNQISNVETALRHENWMGLNPDWFSILENNISSCSKYALSFRGVVGGTSKDNKAVISGNIIRNITRMAIQFEIWEGSGLQWGHVAYSTIYKNGFIDCDKGFLFTPPSAKKFYFMDVSWDNGMYGNFWDGFTGTDEDKNYISDTRYIVSEDYGISDEAPLLSMSLIRENNPVSTHPRDLTIEESELSNKSIIWSISHFQNIGISVYIDNESVEYSINGTTINISLRSLKTGNFNVTLALQSEQDDYVYRDVVWVQVLPKTSSLSGFVLANLIVGIISILFLIRRNKQK